MMHPTEHTPKLEYVLRHEGALILQCPEKKWSEVGEISNACLCTLGYHANQVFKLDILWL